MTIQWNKIDWDKYKAFTKEYPVSEDWEEETLWESVYKFLGLPDNAPLGDYGHNNSWEHFLKIGLPKEQGNYLVLTSDGVWGRAWYDDENNFPCFWWSIMKDGEYVGDTNVVAWAEIDIPGDLIGKE